MENIRKESIQINLNSKDATTNYNYPFNSHVSFSFPSLLEDDPTILYKTISVTNAQLPNSFYIINEYNNTLHWLDDGVDKYAYFTLGNYTATQFITEFQSKTSGNFVVTINRNTGIYTFSHNKPYTFYSSGSTIFNVLGFNPNLDYSDGGHPAHSLTAPFLCDFSGIRRLSIRSSALSVGNRDSAGGSTFEITTIPVNVSSYGIIKYENVSGFEGILSSKTLNNIDIFIYDENNNLIDFNNVPWTISLQINLYRKVQNNDIQTLGNILKNSLNNLGNQSSDAGSTNDTQNQNVDAVDGVNDGQNVDENNVDNVDNGNIEDSTNQIIGDGGLEEFMLNRYGIDL